MQNIILYSVTAGLLVFSYVKNKEKTAMALKKAWKALENILPQFLGVIVLVGIMVAILNPQTISGVIGASSGWRGVLLASAIGAVTLIPGFIAFPTAALLLSNGAGYMQIGAFISSLMMVGVVTLPVEIRFFGKRATFLRNILAFLFSFFVAFVIGKVMGEL
ncbi:MAG: permease [Clostridia bacterium]